MAVTDPLSVAYKGLVEELLRRCETGTDSHACQCLAALSLLAEGWRYGDPDPEDDPGGGERVVDISHYLKLREAA